MRPVGVVRAGERACRRVGRRRAVRGRADELGVGAGHRDGVGPGALVEAEVDLEGRKALREDDALLPEEVSVALVPVESLKDCLAGCRELDANASVVPVQSGRRWSGQSGERHERKA